MGIAAKYERDDSIWITFSSFETADFRTDSTRLQSEAAEQHNVEQTVAILHPEESGPGTVGVGAPGMHQAGGGMAPEDGSFSNRKRLNSLNENAESTIVAVS